MRRDEQLFDADITPGISDEPMLPKDEDHATNVGALADGGNAEPPNDVLESEREVVRGEGKASHTGIGAGNLAAGE